MMTSPQATASPHQPRQRGLSLIAMILGMAFVGFFGLLAARSMGPWIEYFAAVKLVKKLENSKQTDPRLIRRDFDLAASIDRIEAVTGKDLVIVPAGGDRVRISFDYEQKVHVFQNTYLLFEFSSSGLSAGGD